MMPEGRWVTGDVPAVTHKASDYERGLLHGAIDALEHVVAILGDDTPTLIHSLLDGKRKLAAKRGVQ